MNKVQESFNNNVTALLGLKSKNKHKNNNVRKDFRGCLVLLLSYFSKISLKNFTC